MTELAKEYGEGLYALCAEENLTKDVLEQLRMLKDVFRQQPDFLRLLSNMSLGKQERLEILDGALRGQVHPYMLSFLKILCERGALQEFEGCESAYRALYNRDNGVVEAVVTTHEALDAEQKERLIEKLRSMTGHEVLLTQRVDPSVLGGVLLEMNGQRYDNTLRHRLKEIRQAMTGDKSEVI